MELIRWTPTALKFSFLEFVILLHRDKRSPEEFHESETNLFVKLHFDLVYLWLKIRAYRTCVPYRTAILMILASDEINSLQIN